MIERLSRKGMLGILVAGASLLAPVGELRAASDEIGPGMGAKLKRGVVDTFTGIVEWPVQTYKGWKRGCAFINDGEGTGSKVCGTAIGFILTGPGHAIGRIGSGVRELFGFWTANPKDNEGNGSPLDAEFAWEDGEPYSIFKPTLGEGIKPWGRKIVRGLGNGFGGILEWPGQMVKGGRNDGGKGVAVGFVKGFWFFLSREAYGFGDAFGFFLPNHKDNPGYAFEEEWAWDSFKSDGGAAK